MRIKNNHHNASFDRYLRKINMKRLCLILKRDRDTGLQKNNDSAKAERRVSIDNLWKMILCFGVFLVVVGAAITIKERYRDNERHADPAGVDPNQKTQVSAIDDEEFYSKITDKTIYAFGIALFTAGTFLVLSWLTRYQCKSAKKLAVNQDTPSNVRLSYSLQSTVPFCYTDETASALVTYYSVNDGTNIVRAARTIRSASLNGRMESSNKRNLLNGLEHV